MRLSGITQESLVDGPGLRYVIFTQGCPHRCPHCHNQDSWDTDAGREFSVKQIIRLLKKQNKTIRGITFSGGEPFLYAHELSQVAQFAQKTGWDVVTYTGYTYEQLTEENNCSEASSSDSIKALLAASNILIDGKYIHEKRTTRLLFRGSRNQRMIDIAATWEKGKVVLWKE